MHRLQVLAFALASVISPTLLQGQSVISARSGLINYFEGVVFLNGQPVARKSGTFARMSDGSTLSTEFGRAEILLTPDTYLRLGEHSSVRLISSSISDTRVELLAGSSILDSAKAPDGAFVAIQFRDATVKFIKPGHYRIDADPPQLRVYEGIAEVTGVGLTNDGKPIRLQASQLLPLDGSTVVKRFTQGSDGLLDLWSEERGELIASNLVNAQTITDPLLDSGPGVPADLASYIGYAPVASLTPLGPGSYGLAYGPFSPYVPLTAGLYQPFPTAAFLYAPRRYTSIFASRPAVGSFVGRNAFIGRTGGIGTTSPPRAIFTPRPVYGGTAPGAAPRSGGITASPAPRFGGAAVGGHPAVGIHGGGRR
jgi:hypothetical protein